MTATESANPDAEPLSAEALQRELRVHQFELKARNEELRRTRMDLAAARSRYIDLYDFAPVGYFSISAKDKVIEANLTAAVLLGEPRSSLLRRGFARFVAPSERPAWQRFSQQALSQDGLHHLELGLQPAGGAALHGRLDCLRFVSGGAKPVLRIALTDFTPHKYAEMDRQAARFALESHEAERRHVARELHEELGQRLTALKMELASLRPALRLATPLNVEPDRTSEMLHALDEALGIVRRVAGDLRPMMLDDLGLNAAIEWLARDSARRLGLSVDVRLQEIVPAPGERASTSIYRLLQETLNFVSRHPNATEVVVSMLQFGEDLVLELQDNSGGRPESPSSHVDPSARMTLRHLARILGCELTIDVAQGAGRRFTLRHRAPHAAHAPAPSFQESR